MSAQDPSGRWYQNSLRTFACRLPPPLLLLRRVSPDSSVPRQGQRIEETRICDTSGTRTPRALAGLRQSPVTAKWLPLLDHLLYHRVGEARAGGGSIQLGVASQRTTMVKTPTEMKSKTKHIATRSSPLIMLHLSYPRPGHGTPSQPDELRTQDCQSSRPSDQQERELRESTNSNRETLHRGKESDESRAQVSTDQSIVEGRGCNRSKTVARHPWMLTTCRLYGDGESDHHHPHDNEGVARANQYIHTEPEFHDRHSKSNRQVKGMAYGEEMRDRYRPASPSIYLA